MDTLLVEGMQGMGDNIYQVPVIKMLAERHHGSIYLKTPWPEFYRHIRILRFVRPETNLRTQRKNMNRYCGYFEHKSGQVRSMRISYASLHGHSGFPIWKALMRTAGLEGSPYFLSIFSRKLKRRNYAVIRPPTVRQEWCSPARNPRPEYIQHAIDHLNAAGLDTVVVADVDPPHETYHGFRPLRATAYFEKGELNTDELIELFRDAKIVVGGVGFMVPLSIATGSPAVVIHGGAGGWNEPKLIDAPGEGKPIHVLPRNYCLCKDHHHNCDKEIDVCDLETAMNRALDHSSRSRTIGRGTMVLGSCPSPSSVR